MLAVEQDAFVDWPQDRRDELAANQFNGAVGDRLVSTSDRVRLWSIHLAPGERIGFHRHVLDYFWTVISGGRSRSYYGDGRIAETSYAAGDTRHFCFAAGEYMIHDLENIGDTDLAFITVEFLDSANAPLPIAGQSSRRLVEPGRAAGPAR